MEIEKNNIRLLIENAIVEKRKELSTIIKEMTERFSPIQAGDKFVPLPSEDDDLKDEETKRYLKREFTAESIKYDEKERMFCYKTYVDIGYGTFYEDEVKKVQNN